MWRGKVVCPGVPLFDAEATLLETDRSLTAEQLLAIFPFNFHLTGRLDKQAGRDYLQQLLSEPNRSVCFLLLQPPSPSTNPNNAVALGMIRNMLASTGKYGVGVGNPQSIKDIYYMTVPEAEAISMLSISPKVTSEDAALVVVVVPQRNLFTL